MLGEGPFRRVRQQRRQLFAHHQGEYGVTEKLQSFVVGRCSRSLLIHVRFVRQRLFQQTGIAELVVERGLKGIKRRRRCHRASTLEVKRQTSGFLKSRQALTPPNPNEFDSTTLTAAGLALCGT